MRTNAIAVKNLIDTDLSDPIVEAFIGDANLFVTNTIGHVDLSPDTLESIEKWIACHLIASTRERQAQKEGAGGAYIEYQGKTGEGLMATMYGQQAVALDTSGTLLSIVKGKSKIKMEAL